jgi:histidinol-phosphate/aromatic aminotransferase/cobyric acid decarboxylase-like protein
VHGGDAPDGVVDCSTGVSPLPPPPAVLAAIAAADVTRYPHPTALPLRRAIAAAHAVDGAGAVDAAGAVDVDCIVAGAGSVELIWALARAFGGPGRRVGYVAPAFAEYAQAARASGAEVLAVADASDARLADVDLAFVARPGNPTLALPSLTKLTAPLTIVDEAYLPLCADVQPMVHTPHLAVLRSLTKLFALPGLRLGYLIAARPVADAVRAALPPWNVSQPAIAAGVAALAEPTAPVRAAIAALRERLVAQLSALRARIVAANGTFVVVDVGDATAFAAALYAHGARVRDCTSFGLPSLVRVGVRGADDQARLVAAWRKVVA